MGNRIRQKILSNMKSPKLCIFFALAIALIVQAHNQECICGGLGQGTNPCSCSEVVVKAAKLPKPTRYVSPQKIKDAVTAINNTAMSSGSSQSGCSDSQSSSQSKSAIQTTGNSGSHSNTSPCSSNMHHNTDTSTYNSNANTHSSSDSKEYGRNSHNPCSDSDAKTQGESMIIYTDGTSSSAPEPIVVYAADVSYADNANEGKSDCGCNKQNIETLDNNESENVDGNVVPRFSPVGDLCYPLPVEPRSGKIVEKTAKVTPAYPGKVVCCNPSVPYEICINTVTGETKSRTITTSSTDTLNSANTQIYEIINSDQFGVPAKMQSKSAPAAYYGSKTYGTYFESNSKVHNLPSLIYANLNTANRQKQYSKAITSSGTSDCFDDATGRIQADSYPAIPADAVSLTLAYKNLRAPNVMYRQGKQFIPEDKLSFGHRTLPTDAKNENKVPDIAEEKLVTLNKPVVELKLAPAKSIVIGSYDEQEEAKLAELEAIEREYITQEETADEIADSLITYKDLGYAPIKSSYTKPRMHSQDIIHGEINDSAEEPCGPLGPPIPDYIPGKVVVQQQLMGDSSSNFGDLDESMEVQPSDSQSCPM